MLLGPAASREGCAEGGGAGRLEVSDPPVPRETQAGGVTARRPPCQRAGLETDPALGGSLCIASDAQVRPAAGLQGIRWLAATAELGGVTGSSPGAVLPGVAADPPRIRPLSALLFSPLFCGYAVVARRANFSARAPLPGDPAASTPRRCLSVRWPVACASFPAGGFYLPSYTFFPLHSYLFGCQEPPSASLLFLPLGQDLPFFFSMHVCKTEISG